MTTGQSVQRRGLNIRSQTSSFLRIENVSNVCPARDRSYTGLENVDLPVSAA